MKKTIKLISCILWISISSTLNAQDLKFEYVKQMGGLGRDYITSIACDENGNVYSTGHFERTVDFNPGIGTTNLAVAGLYNDIFIQKLDKWGNLRWAKRMGGVGSSDGGESITIDPNKNIYSTGYFEGTVDFDPNAGITNITSRGSTDIFIQKLDSTGNLLWVKQIGGTSTDWGLSITSDVIGNVYTTGYFGGTVDFDPNSGTFNLTANGNPDIFIQKLDPNGNLLWVKQMGGTSIDRGKSIAVDDNGNVFTTGVFWDTTDFDPGIGLLNLVSNGYDDIFIQKLDSNGNLVWVKQIGGVDREDGRSITIDPNGDIYITGTFQDTVDFDPNSGSTNLISNGNSDIFIQKLDPNGNLIWVRQMGGLLYDYCYSLTIDDSNNVYTTGGFKDTVDFDPGSGTSILATSNSNDVFIQKLDPNGNLLWVKQIGGTSWDDTYAITTDNKGNLYTAGTFSGTVDFDPDSGTTNLTFNGFGDIFIQKLSLCPNTFSVDTQSACGSYTWIDNVTYTASSNTTFFVLPNSATCDSIITLNLTITPLPNVTATINGFTITANNTNGSSYQWLDCDSAMSVMVGDTNISYTAIKNGNYAIQIIENGCIDTSACFAITTVGLNENSSKEKIHVSPNPTDGNFSIRFTDPEKILSIRLVSSLGQLIETRTIQNTSIVKMELNQPNGIYFLEVQDNNGNKEVIRLIKN